MTNWLLFNINRGNDLKYSSPLNEISDSNKAAISSRLLVPYDRNKYNQYGANRLDIHYVFIWDINKHVR
jgi:hypothetical protein